MLLLGRLGNLNHSNSCNTSMHAYYTSHPHSAGKLTQTIRNPITLPFQQSRRCRREAQLNCKTCNKAGCDPSDRKGHSNTQHASIAAAVLLAQGKVSADVQKKYDEHPEMGLCTAVSCQAALADEIVTKYVPGPVQVGPEIWAGAIAATIPFIIGSWEFAKRILIQRRCQMCGGNGLVMRGRFARKCPECGGFFPWQGWRRFFTSTALPGNGGPLRQPSGQTSIFYKVPEDPRKANSGQQEVLGKEAERDAAQQDEASIER